MSDDEVRRKSEAIAEKLVYAVDFTNVKSAYLYRSVPQWKEVDSQAIEKTIRAHSPQAKTTFASLDKDQPLPHEQFDLIIVPILGFDRRGFRLGLGGGFYDRLLPHQAKAQKIGVAFANSLVAEGIPHEAHDARLDKIITEEDIISL